MTVYPEVQRKAQEEIDRVVGTGRLPTFEDRENLPYVDAIIKEALRWHPVAPIGLPHVATEDDIYNGYYIPKGAMCVPVIWGFMHDPKLFHDPMTFKPERFLGDNPDPDPHTMCFGFGRRICPGKVLADMSVYLTIAQSLAVFNIGKPVENGNVVEQAVEFQPGIISHPVPYKADIKPRSPEHEKLIKSVELEHPWQESDAKYLVGIKA
jgi:cytochrome P450